VRVLCCGTRLDSRHPSVSNVLSLAVTRLKVM
jgi:hypothetical protein